MGREIKRVPLDFDWPLDEVWQGFLMPESLHAGQCSSCEGSGSSPHARHLHDLWYGYVPFRPEDNGSTPLSERTPEVEAFARRNVAHSPEFYGTGPGAVSREGRRLADMWNGQWGHHLNDDDVAALVAAGRLMDLTHTFTREGRWQPKDPPVVPTAAEVNAWALHGFGHDSINAHVVIRARCERDGEPVICADCGGSGQVWRDAEHQAAHEAWEETPPPTGDGWQVWETVSEGSPITPVLPSAEALVDHLATVGTAWDVRSGDGPWRRSAAVAFVGDGWAPSMVTQGGAVMVGGRDADRMVTVAMGRTHVEWLTARLGMWLCDPAGEVFEALPSPTAKPSSAPTQEAP